MGAPGRPRLIADEEMVEFAKVYNQAWEIGQGHRAATIAAQAFGLSRSTCHRTLELAREANLIVEFGDHRPARARFVQGGPSWPVCAECRLPWPCDESAGDA